MTDQTESEPDYGTADAWDGFEGYIGTKETAQVAAAIRALEAKVARLTAELAAARGALQWIADNSGRDTWLSQFERRFNRGDVDDLMAAIDAARRAGGEG